MIVAPAKTFTQTIRFLISPPALGSENMAADAAMFEGLQKGLPGAWPALRIYSWREKTITLGRGYKTKYKISDEMLAGLYPGIPILERPTGGGLVAHEPEGEITIAMTHYRPAGEPIRELYKKIHEPILSAVSSLGIPISLVTECLPEGDGVCFKSPCLYDGMSEGKKVLGGGLRVGKMMRKESFETEYIFLYQGTLKLKGVTPETLLDVLLTGVNFARTWGKPIIQVTTQRPCHSEGAKRPKNLDSSLRSE